jgi:hypothetical protein
MFLTQFYCFFFRPSIENNVPAHAEVAHNINAELLAVERVFEA